ncbi:insertion sequence transposase protein (plasmid) [Rhizobium favelukesii]|uniref:Insertion sequence transposase protein n=1 Tax=Rhizobium favelukesii TaxID=348824 RepID=W6S3N9_9HYPH|nr:insertion sequence transposase protein [Rhizobium favelukesii]
MNIHKNARLTPLRREEMAVSVLGGTLSKAQAARLYGVSPKIVSRWAERFRMSGRAGMMDHSSRPKPVLGRRIRLCASALSVFEGSV